MGTLQNKDCFLISSDNYTSRITPTANHDSRPSAQRIADGAARHMSAAPGAESVLVLALADVVERGLGFRFSRHRMRFVSPVGDAKRRAIVKDRVNGSDIIHSDHRSLCTSRDIAVGVVHRVEHDPAAGREPMSDMLDGFFGRE